MSATWWMPVIIAALETTVLAGPEKFRERFGMEPTYFYRMNEDLNLTPRADEGRGGTRGSGISTHNGANHSRSLIRQESN